MQKRLTIQTAKVGEFAIVRECSYSTTKPFLNRKGEIVEVGSTRIKLLFTHEPESQINANQPKVIEFCYAYAKHLEPIEIELEVQRLKRDGLRDDSKLAHVLGQVLIEWGRLQKIAEHAEETGHKGEPQVTIYDVTNIRRLRNLMSSLKEEYEYDPKHAIKPVAEPPPVPSLAARLNRPLNKITRGMRPLCGVGVFADLRGDYALDRNDEREPHDIDPDDAYDDYDE